MTTVHLRELIPRLQECQRSGLIRYNIIPQFRIQYASKEYPVDFAIPDLKIAIEADGEVFHSSPKQVTSDRERDTKLAQIGWTTLRFQDDEIENKMEQVMQTVVKTIMSKEMFLKKQVEKLKNKDSE